MGDTDPVGVLLTVSAANLDVNATVAVDELGARAGARTVGPVVLWGGLPIDYLQTNSHDPSTFGLSGLPLRAAVGTVEGVTLGARLHITVTNSHGETSTIDFTMPATVDDLDGDGDGLLNSWEEKATRRLPAQTFPWRRSAPRVAKRHPRRSRPHDRRQDSRRPVAGGRAGVSQRSCAQSRRFRGHQHHHRPRPGRGVDWRRTGVPDTDCLTWTILRRRHQRDAPIQKLYDQDQLLQRDRFRLFHYVVWGNRWWEGAEQNWGKRAMGQ